jgi:hypothetical protein
LRNGKAREQQRGKNNYGKSLQNDLTAGGI